MSAGHREGRGDGSAGARSLFPFRSSFHSTVLDSFAARVCLCRGGWGRRRHARRRPRGTTMVHRVHQELVGGHYERLPRSRHQEFTTRCSWPSGKAGQAPLPTSDHHPCPQTLTEAQTTFLTGCSCLEWNAHSWLCTGRTTPSTSRGSRAIGGGLRGLAARLTDGSRLVENACRRSGLSPSSGSRKLLVGYRRCEHERFCWPSTVAKLSAGARTFCRHCWPRPGFPTHRKLNSE